MREASRRSRRRFSIGGRRGCAAREREETKRLLYVALTRARDRLYLSATVQDGECRMGRGSLGEVLPDTLIALFVHATPGHAAGGA